jgi:acyl-CoA synthetase
LQLNYLKYLIWIPKSKNLSKLRTLEILFHYPLVSLIRYIQERNDKTLEFNSGTTNIFKKFKNAEDFAHVFNFGISRFTRSCLNVSTLINIKSLSMSKSFDFGKCIDASPCVLEIGSSPITFIGSHSGYFACLEDQYLLWKTKLGGRIESTACLSSCKKFVCVGCYDSNIYILAADSGIIIKKFPCGDIIKCSPILDSENNFWIGSYDNWIYSFNKDEIIFKDQTDGAIFASPCFKDNKVFVCNTKGSIIAYEDYVFKWKVRISNPIFSSPVIFEEKLFVVDVSGIGYIMNTTNGEILNATSLERLDKMYPIFSSPCMYKVDKKIYFLLGSHSGNISKFSLSDGLSLEWTYYSGNPIFSSPSCITSEKGKSFAITVNINGNVCILDLQSGELIRETLLDVPVFSSPVLTYHNSSWKIIFGGRDNYLHILDLESKF